MNNWQQPLERVQSFGRIQFVAAVLSLLFLTKAASAVDAKTTGNRTIVPGRSIGKLWIGAGRDAIQKVLGKPAQTKQRSDKIIEDIWLLPRSSARSYKVFYLKNRAIQIETTSPTFSIEGLSLRSDPYQIRKKFGPMRVGIYYSILNSQSFTRYLYDNARRGITFSVRVKNSKEVATHFQSVIVHRKGHPVMPPFGHILLRHLQDDTRKKP